MEPAAEELIFVLSFMDVVLMAPVGSKHAMKSSTNLLYKQQIAAK